MLVKGQLETQRCTTLPVQGQLEFEDAQNHRSRANLAFKESQNCRSRANLTFTGAQTVGPVPLGIQRCPEPPFKRQLDCQFVRAQGLENLTRVPKTGPRASETAKVPRGTARCKVRDPRFKVQGWRCKIQEPWSKIQVPRSKILQMQLNDDATK